jgi:glycosyltransferase involved in cell wall biosynthesis
MRVLFTTPILEHPPAGGPQLRIENSIKALSQICELDIIYRAFSPEENIEFTDAFYRQYAKNYLTIFARPLAKKSWWWRNYYRIINRIYDHAESNYAKRIIEHVQRRNIKVVWFGYGNISYSLIKKIKKKIPSLKVVCDTDSVWSRFILREIPYARGLRKLRIYLDGFKKRSEEKAWVNFCDITTAVSEIDAKYYRSLAIEPGKIHIFSNAIDPSNYKSKVDTPAEFKKPSIYLAGSFGYFHSPMDTAARWILDEVFPLVLTKYPDLHFYIVGRDSDRSFGHFNGKNITVTGKLENVLPYLKNTSIALVPLKFESGTRFKILEAGYCRIPLVSTTLGAEGIPLINGEHILIADTAQDFANAIIYLLENPYFANKISSNCHNLINKFYSIAALTKEAESILRDLIND